MVLLSYTVLIYNVTLSVMRAKEIIFFFERMSFMFLNMWAF